MDRALRGFWGAPHGYSVGSRVFVVRRVGVLRDGQQATRAVGASSKGAGWAVVVSFGELRGRDSPAPLEE